MVSLGKRSNLKMPPKTPGKKLDLTTTYGLTRIQPRNNQNLKCQICGRRFIVEDHLQNHLRQKHSTNDQKMNDNATKTGLTQKVIKYPMS